jgi:hypothetical protein
MSEYKEARGMKLYLLAYHTGREEIPPDYNQTHIFLHGE